MKLLLDEMYPAAIAIELRKRGCDPIAVQEDEDLRELSDVQLFDVAQDVERALVTENVKDFAPIEARSHGTGRAHHGVIFTTNRSFPRHRSGFVGALTVALAAFLSSQPPAAPPRSIVHWLQAGGR